jgi:predicted alpha/beta superfamily hydrolase
MLVARALLVVLVAAITLSPAAAAARAKPYTLPNTQVFDLHSQQTGGDYQIYVATPPGYPEPGKHYPVVYALDADYSFALTRNIIQHFVEREGLPPMILVSIAYPGAATDRDLYKLTRTRDYTPMFVRTGGYGLEFQKVSGGAPKFKAFLASELFPFIERKFAADPNDRTIVGHSYGGLFATYLLLTEPSMYNRYVIVSPSLWYSERIAFQMEEAASARGEPAKANVFLSVGALENPAMPNDLSDFYNRLKARNRPGLKLTLKIFEDERHDSVFPAAVTRGLRTVFESLGPRRPAQSPIP